MQIQEIITVTIVMMMVITIIVPNSKLKTKKTNGSNTTYIFCGDVTFSLKEPYKRAYDINKNIPKIESLFQLLENIEKIISKKNDIISFLLFGSSKSPIRSDFLLIIDFIIYKIQLFIEYFNNDRDYPKLLIKLLEDAGATYISKYMNRTELSILL